MAEIASLPCIVDRTLYGKISKIVDVNARDTFYGSATK